MEQNNYFDINAPYTEISSGDIYYPYAMTLPAPEPFPPIDAIRGNKPEITKGFWPCTSDKKFWMQIEDHRGEAGYKDGKPCTISELGPSPTNWSETPPPPTKEEQYNAERTAKLSELNELHSQALAGAIALADPSPVNVAIESALWAQEDAESLQFLRDSLETQYTALKKQLAMCTDVEELKNFVIRFAV